MVHSHIPRWLVEARKADPGFSLPRGEKPRWVERLLRQSGLLPAAAIPEAVGAGRLRLDGQPVTSPLALVRPGQRLTLDGEPVALQVETLVLMLHKPAGYVVTRRANGAEPTVFELLGAQLPAELARYEWHAIGRLDRATTGLLLLTNDARLVAHVSRPAGHLPKRYLAEVSRAPTDSALEPLRAGIALGDGLCRPAQVTLRAARSVVMTLTEGRRHQVRRMLAAVRLPVRRLHREAIGEVTLDVAVGEWRLLTQAEIRGGLGFDC